MATNTRVVHSQYERMAPTDSSAIRSLNADFVRKGIVVSGDGEEGAVDRSRLDPKIRQLVETLKSSCKASGTRELPEITSAIQIWKERSLHHTLQTLDQAEKDALGKGMQSGHERHIQAIELHEKARREVKESILRVVDGIVVSMVRDIESFTVKLAAIIREIAKPELEEELMKERSITERLILERQKLMHQQVSLQETNTQLTQRVQALEDAPDGGGDAILCRKLRLQVAQLTQKQREMDATMLQMEHDHEKWRYEMVKMQTEMEIQHKTLAMTRAMHDKETRQLVDLVHAKSDEFELVKRATSTAIGSRTMAEGVGPTQHSLTVHDVHSGRSISYQSPQKAGKPGPLQSHRPVLATIPPPSSPVKTSRPPSGLSSASPNKKRTVSVSYSTNNNTCESPALDISPGEGSPRGRVHRPFTS